MRALVCVQFFPPLCKIGGGVSKRYKALCKALIDGLGWEILLCTPVAVAEAHDPDIERWLISGALRHIKVHAFTQSSGDGKITYLDLFGLYNAIRISCAVCFGGCDICITEDIPFRFHLFLLTRSVGLPSVTTSHTDATHLSSYQSNLVMRLGWAVHMASAHVVTVHASVSRVYAELMRTRYGIPVQAIWPPILWDDAFQRPVQDFTERAAAERGRWVRLLGFEPTSILLSAGRWSAEKRLHLLIEAVPEGCALVVVGDSTSPYADEIEATERGNVLALRKMLNAEELRTAYAACDMLISASNFETLGNVVIEAWCAGVPVAVQPEQGHLEYVEDNFNSYFVDFDRSAEAKQRLQAILTAGPRSAIAAELDRVGERFRTLDFPRELNSALLEPALKEASEWSRRGPSCILELLTRLFFFFVWFVTWPIMAAVTRLVYLISGDFEFVWGAGSVVEPEAVPLLDQTDEELVDV
jgi:glycosyltransferase involved in cell wall biosynthesis